MAGAALEVALEIARLEHGLESSAVPLTIIGMGKAGARELNYLSDVDVITSPRHLPAQTLKKYCRAPRSSPGIPPDI